MIMGVESDFSETLAEVESEKTDAKGWRRETFSDPREGLTEVPPAMPMACSRLTQDALLHHDRHTGFRC